MLYAASSFTAETAAPAPQISCSKKQKKKKLATS
jgi:hypothetical protein